MTNQSMGFGLGLRAPHYDEILATRPRAVAWFEIISENFLDAHAGYWEFLTELRRDYPIVMHGVSLNIGSPDPLNGAYLGKLKKLADHLDTPWVSDHLCWTGVNAHNSHDLLPLPYSPAMLAHIAERIDHIQQRLGRRFVLENPSSYLEFSESTIPEYEFLAQLAERSGCGLLLDVNNVYVSAFNHGLNAEAYIDAIPAGAIAQIHLAGHRNLGTHIIDTHDGHVIDPVWQLYEYTLRQKGFAPTMIEWDEKIPPLATLLHELGRAQEIAARVQKDAA